MTLYEIFLGGACLLNLDTLVFKTAWKLLVVTDAKVLYYKETQDYAFKLDCNA